MRYIVEIVKPIIFFALFFSTLVQAQTTGFQEGSSTFSECSFLIGNETVYKGMPIGDVLSSLQMLNGCPPFISTKTVSDDETQVFWIASLYKIELKKDGRRFCKYARYASLATEGYIRNDRLMCLSKF